MPRRWVIGALTGVAAFLLIGRFAAAAFVDYLWFASLGATELWSIEFENRLLLGAGSAFIAILFVLANLYAVRQSVVSLVLPRRLGNLEIGEEVPGRYLTQLTIGASLLIGLIASFPGDRWLELAAARYGVLFKEYDPFFGYDLSFYVNRLPFEKSLFLWCLVLLVVVMLLVFFLYALTPSLKWTKGEGLQVTHYVRRHAGVLSGCALLILAWSFRLEMFETMLQGSGIDGVFTAADRAMLHGRTALTVIALLAAFLLMWAMWTDQLRLSFICVTTVLIATLGTNAVLPLVVRESAAPNEVAESERLYAGFRAGSTRRAYGVDEVQQAEPVGAFSFASWSEAVLGISAWDPEQLEIAAARKAGGGRSNGNAGYEMSRFGQIIATVVEAPSPASTDPSSVSVAPPAWSLVRALSGSTMPDGAPRPVPESAPVIPLHRVLISRPAPQFVLTADTLDRIGAPEMESPISRIAHAWSRQDFRMLFRDLPRPHPRILLHADVRDRLRKLAPFFAQDSLVYPVILGDTLFWTVQLYSHSSTYPLSRAASIGDRSTRYYHHAATAIVNAATGSVALYVREKADPMAETWGTRLPTLFAPVRAMPSEIAAFLPPAIDGARVQAEAYASYGGHRDSVYDGSLAQSMNSDSTPIMAHHALVHLPVLGATPAWIQPLLDGNKRMNQLIVALGGGSPQTYRLATTTARQSWLETQRRLDTIRDSITTREEGSVVAGPVRAIPVGGEVALVRTTYAFSGSSGPVIAAVTIIAGDSVWTAAGLSQAARVRSPAGDEGALTPTLFRARVQTLYDTMRATLEKGDFTAFGEALNALGALLAGVRR